MTKVIIHAGFHKTGTTSLQRFLEINETALVPHVCVIMKPQMEDVAACARDCSNASLLGLKTFKRVAFRRRFADLLHRTVLENGQTLLISCEALVGRMPGRDNVIAFDAAAGLAQDMARVMEKHFGNGLDLTFLYTTRECDAWMQSAYSHLLHQSKFTLSEAGFMEKFNRAGDLEAVVGHIAEAIAPRKPLTSRLETTASEPFGPASALLKLLDLPSDVVDALESAKQLNRGPDAFELGKMLEFNNGTMDGEELNTAKRKFLRKRRNRLEGKHIDPSKL